jgi:hypothetical protein
MLAFATADVANRAILIDRRATASANLLMTESDRTKRGADMSQIRPRQRSRSRSSPAERDDAR